MTRQFYCWLMTNTIHHNEDQEQKESAPVSVQTSRRFELLINKREYMASGLNPSLPLLGLCCERMKKRQRCFALWGELLLMCLQQEGMQCPACRLTPHFEIIVRLRVAL